jgi:hypothetical protein
MRGGVHVELALVTMVPHKAKLIDIQHMLRCDRSCFLVLLSLFLIFPELLT